MLSDLRNAGLEPPRRLYRAGIDGGQPESALLIEPQRIEIVVGSDEPDPIDARPASRVNHLIQQRGPNAGIGNETVQRDHLTPIPVKPVGDHPYPRALRQNGRKPLELPGAMD